MNTEEKYELIETEVEAEVSVLDRVKDFLAKIGRRNLIIIGAVLLVGVAICLNWVLFADNNDEGYDYGDGSGTAGNVVEEETDEVLAYFASTQHGRYCLRGGLHFCDG